MKTEANLDNFIERINSFEKALSYQNHSIIDENLNIVHKYGFKWRVLCLLRPFYALFHRDVYSHVRADNVSKSIFTYCEHNKDLLENDPKLISRIRTNIFTKLRDKTGKKYHQTLTEQSMQVFGLNSVIYEEGIDAKKIAEKIISRSFTSAISYKRFQNAIKLKNERKREKEKIKRESAAVTIQRVFRGSRARIFAEREKKYTIPISVVETVQELIETTRLSSLPREIRDGSTAFSLTQGVEFPVVIRCTQHGENVNCCKNMKVAIELCEKLDIKHLTIPGAKPVRNFLVEKKLPLGCVAPKAQIGLYLENDRIFTPAVEDFARLYFNCSFYNVIGLRNYYRFLIGDVKLPNYDSFPLYFDEKGKPNIALLNLEHLLLYPESLFYKDWIPKPDYSSVAELLTFFPLHFEEIMKIANEYNPDIVQKTSNLIDHRNKVLEAYRKIYSEHIEFLTAKGISVANPNDKVTISKPRRQEIWTRLSAKLHMIHNGQRVGEYLSIHKDAEGFLGSNPDKALKKFKFDPLFEDVITYIRKLVNGKLTEFEGKRVNSNSELVEARTVFFESGSQSNLNKRLQQYFSHYTYKRECLDSIACLVIETIFEEMASGKEILLFKLDYYSTTHMAFC